MNNNHFGLANQRVRKRKLKVARGRGNQGDWAPSKTYSKPLTAEQKEWNENIVVRKVKRTEIKGCNK